MKSIRAIRAAVVMGSVVAAAPVLAQGIPVYDNSNTLQNIQQVANQVQQLKSMADDYANQIEQLTNLARQTSAMTGTRNMGDLLNGQLEAQMRRYLPNDLNGLLNMRSGSGPAIAGAQRVFERFYDEYDPISGADLDPSNPTGPLALSTDRRTNTTYASLAASEQAYNNVERRIQMVETMLGRLNASTDVKESMDLQARITAENALIQSEMMRLQTLQMQSRGAETNESLVRLRQANEANRFDPVVAAGTIQ